MSVLVPNQFPTIDLDYRFAVVGEQPGTDEETMRQPFVGPTSKILLGTMQKYGIPRNAIFMGNILQRRIPGELEKHSFDEEEIQEGMAQLKSDLIEYQPNCILVMGGGALRAARIKHKIHSFRGSIFKSDDDLSPFYGFKCVASQHPAYTYRVFEDRLYFLNDFKRGYQQSYFPELRLPERRIEIDLKLSEVVERLAKIEDGDLIAVDIEGGIPNPSAKVEHRFPNGITTVGFATSPNDAFVVNLKGMGVEEKIVAIKAMHRVLMNPKIHKILQHGLYDKFVFQWLWSIDIRGMVYDTELSSWELMPELPKALGTQVSLYTEQPYYKFERKIDDDSVHQRYCGMDACVTFELALKHETMMNPKQKEHYEFNVKLVPAVNYMELKGFNYDKAKAAEKLAEVKVIQSELQARIDAGCGYDPAQGQSLNPNSPKQMAITLYNELGFEKQWKTEGYGASRTRKITTDEDALLTIWRKTHSPLIFNILKWKKWDSQRKQLSIEPDPDGRMRSAINVVGTDTGRFSSKETPTGSGANMTTTMKELRMLYTADPGHYIGEIDLEGADGYTIAAACRSVGDNTMLDDYAAGIKPAQVLMVLYTYGAEASRWPRPQIIEAFKQLKAEAPKWLYPACKATAHGTNYDMKEQTMSMNILKRSWKESRDPIYVSPKDCSILQQLYNGRYWGVKAYHGVIARTLRETSQLVTASGSIRTFLGRYNDQETLRSAYSFLPQFHTTYATSLAISRLWSDEENWDNGRIIIEPIFQVHDAFLFQWPIERTDWAVPKVKNYFENEIEIFGYKFVMPYDGHYGPSWGESIASFGSHD